MTPERRGAAPREEGELRPPRGPRFAAGPRRSASSTATSSDDAGVEEADDEGVARFRSRGVQLPAGETEAGIRGSHVRQSALRQPQPPARGDLDLAVRHTPEALLDRVDGNAR
jgi:hypothetical protein